MSKFKVGDKIVANEGVPYVFTKGTAVMVVAEVLKDSAEEGNDIRVEIINHGRIEHVGKQFSVKSRHFDFLSIRSSKAGLDDSLLSHLTHVEVDSLVHSLVLKPEVMVVGCQKITPEDAVILAKRILWAYE